MNKGNRNELPYIDVDRADAFVVLNASSIISRRTAVERAINKTEWKHRARDTEFERK